MSGLTFSQAVDGFALARLADGYSPATIAQYRWGLRFCAALDDKPLPEVTTDDLRRVLAQTQARDDLGATSKFHVWKAIRAFYKWAEAEGMTGRPDKPLTMPRHAAPVISPLTPEEVKKLLKVIDRTAPTSGEKRTAFTMSRPTAARDRAVILTLLDTGLRASELGRLRVADVDLVSGAVTVRPYRSGAKSRPRVIPIGQATRKALWKYRAATEGKPDDWYFHSEDGGQVTRSALLHLLVRVGKRAGVPNVHPHRFRHTFAITFLRNGGDVFTLQRLLGHASLEMTRHYLALAQADDDQAHKRASPVDNWRL